MPTGVYITLQEKKDINTRYLQGLSPREVWIDQFNRNNNRISVRTISHYFKVLKKLQYDPRRTKFFANPKAYFKTGRRRVMIERTTSHFLEIVQKAPNLRVKTILRRYLKTVPDNPLIPFRKISIETAYRTLHRANWTDKVSERRHMKIDHRENLLMLREMSIFNPKCIIAIDGMNCSSESFRNKRSCFASYQYINCGFGYDK